ncbi:MAG: alpha/beta hydrolase [Limisphaerales bacterium]
MTAHPRRRWLVRLGQLALGLAVLFMLLRWFEHKQTYHPTRTHYASAAELGRAWEDVTFTAADGVALHGWFFPGDTQSPRARLVVLLCHGNGGNISHRLGLYDVLLESGVSVFAFDYRGYGRSAGRPSEAGTYRDAHAAHAWLRAKGFSATNIIAYGESLGGGVASELALTETVGALVLHSTFTSLPDIGAELFPWLPVRLVGSIRYDTRSRLPHLRIPVLILHSRADSLVRFHHAERNFAAANEPKWLREIPGDHNDGIVDRAGFLAAWEILLQRLERAAPADPMP